MKGWGTCIFNVTASSLDQFLHQEHERNLKETSDSWFRCCSADCVCVCACVYVCIHTTRLTSGLKCPSLGTKISQQRRLTNASLLGLDSGANRRAAPPSNTPCSFDCKRSRRRGDRKQMEASINSQGRWGQQQWTPSSRWLPSPLGQLAIKPGGTSVGVFFFPLKVTKYANTHSCCSWGCTIAQNVKGSENEDEFDSITRGADQTSGRFPAPQRHEGLYQT